MKLNKKRIEAAQARQIARTRAQEIMDDAFRRADIAVIATLHYDFGFGKDRIMKFYTAMVKRHNEMKEKWQCGDDNSHYLIMLERLKYDGIDVEQLQKEVDEL